LSNILLYIAYCPGEKKAENKSDLRSAYKILVHFLTEIEPGECRDN
jgi:hypothetical protein